MDKTKVLIGLFASVIGLLLLTLLVLMSPVGSGSGEGNSLNTVGATSSTTGATATFSAAIPISIPSSQSPLKAHNQARYYDYSRADWRANPVWDGRLKVYAPASTTGGKPYSVISPDLDTGKSYRLTVQPGQLIALPDPAQKPTGITIHDTATSLDPYCTLQQSKATLQSIQRYHALEAFGHIVYGTTNGSNGTASAGGTDPRHQLDNRGLVDSSSGDIAYHFLIDCAGRVFEGRAGGIFVEGEHIHRHNRGQIGIALIGSFDQQPPPPAQHEALVRLLTRLCRDLSIDPMGVWQEPLLDSKTLVLKKNGQPVLNIAVHRDFPDNDHSDPGRLDLAALRQLVKVNLN